MTRKMKTNLKVIGATALCIFSLSTAFTATLAWFQFNRTTPVTGMSVRVSLGQTDLKQLTVHRCDFSKSTRTTLQFDPNPSYSVEGHGAVVEASGITMDNYSTLNQSQPVLLLFTFDAGIYEDELTITATTENDDFTESLTAENVSSFPFSSTVTFKCLTYPKAQYSDAFPYDDVDIGELVDDDDDPLTPSVFNPFYSSSSFVTITGTGNSATYSYTDSPVLFDGSDPNYSHTELAYLAIVLDYYPEAIEYIKGHTLNYAGIVLTNHNEINYVCDWMLEM